MDTIDGVWQAPSIGWLDGSDGKADGRVDERVDDLDRKADGKLE